MLLEVDVEKKFQGFDCRLEFAVNSKTCGVFGPSGSGKSTLMKMLSGLIAPDFGAIRLNERVLFDSSRNISVPPHKRKIGLVFQDGHLFPHLNVMKNLLYGMKRRAPEERSIDPDQLITLLQLENLLSRSVDRLSGGEKQRVALGRTLLSCPELILMDEPLSALDGQLKYQIIPHLRRVFSDFSIPMLFISHSLQEMRMMTEDVLVMHQGRIEKQVSTDQLARTTVGSGGRGFSNLLQLQNSKDLGGLVRYEWEKVPLMLVKTDQIGDGQFSLNARDILLFKKHPEAASARNMLRCTVASTYQTDWLIGVELICQGNRLIAEVVPQSVEELGIAPGAEVVAVIKASAFERLY